MGRNEKEVTIMKTKQEQRAEIMELLESYKAIENNEIEMAKFVISEGGKPEENLANTLKFGKYFPIKELHETIASAMSIEMVDCTFENMKEFLGVHDVVCGYRRTDRKTGAVYKTVGFTKTEFATIQLVINRMAEQGYIKVSKSGRGFRVLKVDD